MLNTLRATHGMAVAPHGLAAQAGLGILQDGGTALEAAVGMAAALSVLYPHMTGIGGDSFWVVAAPGEAVTTIDACGRTPAALDSDYYRQRGLGAVPIRGPHAANTVAGTLSGWHTALELSRHWGGRLPLSRLLEEAIGYADSGHAVSASLARCTARKSDELRDQPGFADVYLPSGKALGMGTTLRQPALAQTLRRLAGAGIDDFYRGELAAAVAADLAVVGSPVALEDLQAQRALTGAPLALSLGGHLPAGMLYSTAPPTQGIVTLLILGQFASHSGALPPVDSPDYVHLLVEATKQAFPVRDRMVCDPQDMAGADLGALLEHAALAERAGAIDMHEAAPWGEAGNPGDTTWFGVIDGEGRAVSCIQSLYHEFGSAVVLPTTGICWQNRGSSFSLDPDHPRYLRPNRKPFHTLCPSLARFDDGRVMPFGTMGGDGQPQTQAAVFSRYAAYGQSLQEAVSAPRWLLGRTWGASSDNLKLEGRFGADFAQTLADRGHAVETVADYDEMMGHAGALVLRPDGVIEGAADPRSDGAAVGY